jgi:hypothetical protein
MSDHAPDVSRERGQPQRIFNNPFWPGSSFTTKPTPALPDLEALERVYQRPPQVPNLPQINFDFSDFEQVDTDDRGDGVSWSRLDGTRQNRSGLGWPDNAEIRASGVTPGT